MVSSKLNGNNGDRVMEEISFREFQQLDLRIGKVTEAERVSGSRNLIKIQVDFGEEKRQAVAGLAQYYTPKQLVGNEYMFICNLEPRRLMGVEDGEGKVVLIQPEREVNPGSKVR
jgi:methionine--tRNA ligase beta chain